jgi:cytochrome c
MKNVSIIFILCVLISLLCGCGKHKKNDGKDLTIGFYYIISLHSGKYLEVPDNSLDDNMVLIQNSFSGQPKQQWRFQKIDNNVYVIISRMSKKCIDVKGCAPEDNKLIVQNPYQGKLCQQWKLKSNGDSYNIISNASLKCIDIPGGSKEDGVNLFQYTANDKLSQCWIIKPVE